MSDPIKLPVKIVDESGNPVGELRMHAAEGDQYMTLVIFNGDIINLRNLQGGTWDKPNLDIGAGGSGNSATGPRGNIVLNYDVGNAVEIFDGRKKRIVAINLRNNRRIDTHIPVRFYSGASVPDGKGGWRHL